MYSMENLLQQDYRSGTSAFRFPYLSQGERDFGYLRESLPFEKKSKLAISSDADVDSEDEILKEKEKAKLKMLEDIKDDEDDQDARDNRNQSETFVAVIAQSILSVPTKRMTLSSIYSYIANNYPHFDKEKGPGWRNSVRHNLSSNDCFVKASRAENGKGHYWMIHPKDLPEFSKGNFRRPRKPRRPRCTHGIGCLSDRTIFPSALGGSYYMSPYSAKHPDYDFSLPMLASSPDVLSRTYGVPSRYSDTFQRDDGLGISSYHNISSSSSPTYLGFPWPDSSVFRNYAALNHAYHYPYMIMPPSVSEVSVLRKDSPPKSKND